MRAAFINRIGTAVPLFDVHRKFIDFATSVLGRDSERRCFLRMIGRSQIEHRYSVLSQQCFESGGFYERGKFPDTSERMVCFENEALRLAATAIDQLDITSSKNEITHLIVACCTGFYAPGLDIDIVTRFGLSPAVERTVVGFMGCYAGISALKLARHIVRSEPQAKVLVVNLELCTLHLQEVDDLERMLCFSLWGDGCSASLVSADPLGIELQSFHTTTIEGSADQMAWRVGDHGFDMLLSGKVAPTIARTLPGKVEAILGIRPVGDIALWAVHPGGRTILDAVAQALRLDEDALSCSREVLRRFGNMSSATVIFVLKAMLERGLRGLGCAMAFGPGLTAESMLFEAI